MSSRTSLAYVVPVLAAVGCAPASPTDELLPSSEAVAIVSDVQTRFALPGRDFRSIFDPAPILRRELRRWPVMAQKGETPLTVDGGMVRRSDKTRLNVALGRTADQGFTIGDPKSGVSAKITLEGATPAPAELVDGYIAFLGGHESGAHIFHHVGATSHEDFLLLQHPVPQSTIRYRMDLDSHVAGLRLVDDVLELLDASGAPRVHMQRPYLVEESGRRIWATVSIDDCLFDTDPAVPFDRPVTPPGTTTCHLAVSWFGQDVKHPVLLDPAWTLASDMTSAREGHTMVLLSTGNVLCAGGSDGTSTLASAEVYNPTSDAWAATSPLPNGERYGAADVKLANEPILIGGFRGTDTITGVSAVERYNTTAGTWTGLTSSPTARFAHTATTFVNSVGTTQILVAGGYGVTTGAILNTTERGTGAAAWSTGTFGGAAFRRTNHTATRMNSGRVILVAGYGGTTQDTYLTTNRLYNNTGNSWGVAAPINTARKDHTATLLADGRVLIVGGTGTTGGVLASAELYSEAPSNTWNNLGDVMSFARAGHAATLMADNTVLITGGLDDLGAYNATAEVFDPSTNSFSLFGTDAPNGMVFHRQALLPDTRVMITGGVPSIGSGTPTAHCHFYDPTAN